MIDDLRHYRSDDTFQILSEDAAAICFFALLILALILDAWGVWA